MAEFKISRIRYTWRGSWVTARAYNRDDVVSYGGISWVCVRQHTSSAFKTNQEFLANPGDTDFTPAWVKMSDGYAYKGAWAQSTVYNEGDILLYGGALYLVVSPYTSSSIFDTDILNLTVYAANLKFREDWSSSARYGIGDVVRYGGNSYQCVLGHTASSASDGIEVGNNDSVEDSTLETWQLYYEGIDYKGTFTLSTRYKLNDLVTYNGSVLRCSQGHTASTFDETKWTVEFYGSEFDSDWVNNVYYGIGSVVRNGGYLFYASKANYDKSPIDSIYQPIEVNWQILSKGVNFRGVWSSSTYYRTGDVVRRGGNLYVATSDTVADGSSLDYLDISNWETLYIGQNYRSGWLSSSVYSVNDLILFNGSIYKCNTEHTASDDNFPGDNGSGFNYWDLVVEVANISGLRNRGDLLTYDLSRDEIGDLSTFGLTRVALGNEASLLSIDSNDSLIYKRYGEVSRAVFVDPTGVDDVVDPLRGYNSDKPWKTIRYACDQLDDGYTGYTTIHLSTGLFEEILPIIVPARTVILGSELRSTTIKANDPITNLALDSTYTIAVLDRISDLIQDVLAGNPLNPAKTPSNPLSPVKPTKTTITPVPFEPPQFDNDGNQIYDQLITVEDTNADPQAAIDVQELILDIINYINFYINSGSTNPTLIGTNTAVTAEGYTDAVLILEANKDFLAEEAVAFMRETYPSYDFDETLCKRDVHRYIDAFKYDIIYTGNYKSLYAARYYRNAVLGSSTDDMFYLRDATGLRNCTLKGLSGTLNPPNVFDLYQRPTGGAFCSLDPGWGPNDNRTWILTRSPYIQGVTTFGSNCIGQKIDGALHNGGNKSFVSNDFTQVLSDGVGAWVTNNGRAELVSVFTYYCTIGYLAERGGIIRAANGNNSYGNYGAISDGVDPTETPGSATVYNRNQQAIVATAFAGDFVDEIQILEWTNAGQNYTEATASFVGAGVNAEVVFEDFRDDAVFECRLLDRNEGTASIATDTGGSGYVVVQNNAQTGNTTSITISTNDSNEEENYLGMRMILTSGPGTGQYGYITAYDEITKIVNVSRESDDQPGWDHVRPGYPIEDILGTQTTYRIEPRVTFSDPGFIATTDDLGTSTYWTKIVYGDTYETYTNIIMEDGEGTTVEVTPAPARFTVVKNGRDYTVTLVNPGAGYEVGQEYTVLGTSIGGTTPYNDITITVTGTSDDSTNSITSFSYSGTAFTGRFVVISDQGSAIVYSSDGDSWDAENLPSEGYWKCLAAGRASAVDRPVFVAIKNDSSAAASSYDGITWTARSMPSSKLWNSVAYGDGIFVAVAEDSDAGAISTNGITWTATTLPDSDDSSVNEWVDIAYGKERFVALANSNNVVAIGTWNGTAMSWTNRIMDVVADSSQKDWVSIAYGNDRFVAISSTGEIAYSFDGSDWLPGTMPSQDGSTAHYWKSIKYAQGLFFAVGDTGGRDIAADPSAVASNFAATSPDGVNWTARTLATSGLWTDVAFGSPFVSANDSTIGKGTPMWIAIASQTNVANKILTGARAQGRANVAGGKVNAIRIWNPGSGYRDPPSITLVDPNNSVDALVENRLGDGVLAEPSWINRGLGYRTATTRVIISGDGFADVIPSGKFVTISNLAKYYGPGAQITFSGNSEIYTAVAITELGTINGGLSALIRLSPELKVRDKVEHGTTVSIRERYSQCRITGHDFLDIGTGNFLETNYPELYATGNYLPRPENEVYEEEGGRVFYTSTDQSGNFRTGELFAVEQATGIVTISADFFDLAGLTELRLGGIRVGGTGAVIREFSTDPLFTEDSNNIVPTQRAIAAYLANRLSLGGSEIATASFIAGTVKVGPNLITNVAGLRVVFPVRADFDATNSGISGSIMAQTMFYRSFN